MARVKHVSRKKHLGKKLNQNRPVPIWVIPRTNRKVRYNPNRRYWRRGRLKV